MPICGEDDRLKGMLTDRDIVVIGARRGQGPVQRDRRRRVERRLHGKTVTLGADDSIDEALRAR